MKKPWLLMLALAIFTMAFERYEGRLWISPSGKIRLWCGDIWSSECSQQLADPYSFTHILHGFIFLGLISLIRPGLTWPWQLWWAMVVEASWEMLENSAWLIQRYRAGTMALGYTGDSILNSMSDIAMCLLGLCLARWLGLKRGIAVFIITELVLLVWIRDGLLLNILMLVYPIPAIKQWQSIH